MVDDVKCLPPLTMQQFLLHHPIFMPMKHSRSNKQHGSKHNAIYLLFWACLAQSRIQQGIVQPTLYLSDVKQTGV